MKQRKAPSRSEWTLLKELSEAPGVPGREEAIREIVERELGKYVDSITVDALGNCIAFRKGRAAKRQRVMFAAHMDEIGFVVSFVDDRGFARVQDVGGFDTRHLFSRRMLVHTSKGPLRALLNPTGKPLHSSTPEERRASKEVSDFYLDFGLPGRKVKELVKVGDMVTLDAPFIELGECVTGKCLDNRVQVYVGIRVLQQLKNPKHDVFGVFTVQEEVGIRGATVSSFKVEPDIGIGLDMTVAADVPGVAAEHHVTKLGAGVGIKVMDSNLISSRELVDTFTVLAERHKIRHQLEVLPRGGTDGGALQRTRAGTKAITLSVPARYLHTTTETAHKEDILAAKHLLLKYLES